MFSLVTITCHFHLWTYLVFVRKLTCDVMWRSQNIPKLKTTFPSEVLVASHKKSYRNLTVLALEEAFISLCQSSRVTIVISIAKLNDRCFCYVMAAMCVSLRRAQTWRLYTKLYKFGRHTSANSTRMKNSRDLILGEVVYIAIIYHILDSWIYLSSSYNFSFGHMTGENREYNK